MLGKKNGKWESNRENKEIQLFEKSVFQIFRNNEWLSTLKEKARMGASEICHEF